MSPLFSDQCIIAKTAVGHARDAQSDTTARHRWLASGRTYDDRQLSLKRIDEFILLRTATRHMFETPSAVGDKKHSHYFEQH